MGTGKGPIRVKERGSKGVEKREEGKRGGSFITESGRQRVQERGPAWLMIL